MDEKENTPSQESASPRKWKFAGGRITRMSNPGYDAFLKRGTKELPSGSCFRRRGSFFRFSRFTGQINDFDHGHE
ncbi:hypothetical protein, partial [Akkermansia sp.]|uniref:hypothetical protein n=1 Tax=Akkermansia sp. TaxID=1872421 RepID=UPI003990EC1E